MNRSPNIGAFFNTIGQKAKYSLREHIVRFALDSGLKSDMAVGPKSANNGSQRSLFDHLIGAGE